MIYIEELVAHGHPSGSSQCGMTDTKKRRPVSDKPDLDDLKTKKNMSLWVDYSTLLLQIHKSTGSSRTSPVFAITYGTL
jgi:hypothetical protein